MVRVVLGPEFLDGGINLHSCDRLDSIGQRCRGIRPASRTQDQRVAERVAWEDLIQTAVKGLLVLPGNHRLVTPRVVYIDDIPTRNSRMEQDLVVRRPVGTQLHLPGDGDARQE